MSANAVKMPILHRQQFPRGVMPTYVSTHFSRVCQDFDEDMKNG